MCRVLVTGGTGLVGKAIQAIAHTFPEYQLVYAGTADGDLRNEADVRALFSRHAPLDGVIHLAANVGGVFKNMSHPVEMFQDNILMNTNVLRVAHECNIQTVLCFLSTCIFPDDPPAYPITAEMLHHGPPHHSNEGYAYAKRMQEVICRAYQTQYNRRYFCVVPTNIYGPYDNFHLHDAHVVPALIHKCWIAKQQGIPFVVSGDGSPLRQFIYSHDVAKLVLWSFGQYASIERPLVLCPPDAEVTIKTLVEHIVDAFDYKDEVVFDTTKTNGQHKKTADVTQLARLAHGIEYTPLKKGIHDVVTWFIAAYKERRRSLRVD